MKLPRRSRSATFDLQMTAMIDVVFLLLIFFLWTSSFDEPEFDLASALSLPPVGNTRISTEINPVPYDEIVVRILHTDSGQREIQFNQSPIENLSELKRRLNSIAAIGAQPAVIVHPDAVIPMEIAISVYDVARAAGFDRVLFAIAP